MKRSHPPLGMDEGSDGSQARHGGDGPNVMRWEADGLLRERGSHVIRWEAWPSVEAMGRVEERRDGRLMTRSDACSE